jgi:glycosyltransferase involved in cell wall biosynthesis
MVQRISVMVPMLNEADHVEHLIADIAAQDFPGEIEVIVADGGSTDGSIERLLAAADAAGVDVTVLDNPDRWVSSALNRCIERSTGDLLVRLDCHTRYPSDYLRLCAAAFNETGAWNVGGLTIPMGRSPTQRAVACAMDSPFGGILWTRHRPDGGRVAVDIVHCGAYAREGFERVGSFDESLVRNQDDDMALRLQAAGGAVLLDTAIQSHYLPRESLRRVFSQYYQYGLWKVAVMRKHRRLMTSRSLAPLMLVSSIGVLLLAAPTAPSARKALAAEVGVYGILALSFGMWSLRRHSERLRLLPRVLATFPTFHVSYGLGMAVGWARAALSGRIS